MLQGIATGRPTLTFINDWTFDCTINRNNSQEPLIFQPWDCVNEVYVTSEMDLFAEKLAHWDYTKSIYQNNYLSVYSNDIRTDLVNKFRDWLGPTDRAMSVESFVSWLFINKIDVPSIADIAKYLSIHQDLMEEVIFPVLNKAVKKFDQITFEINDDPNNQYLLSLVRHHEFSEEIMNQIELIQESYVNKLIGKSGWFLFTTDFESPR